ncbi:MULTISPECIES: hypothetical protein [Culturomica]|jgi:hypothetical protein|uniref:hypothetical protein n=1 Tax=Culturomica TaxID=1926651 RepID=UPI00033BFFD0|nr:MULTISPECIES: hypothetical protein [Odoribacteraceae]RHV98335.1 hypothetical protein DXA95_01230 [Odoribacter sp. OF09-27XD]CCZ09745.1 putative uncharacterized protein [Odoribacter sp. CAG:788]HBO25644.1 hypothetical protein [Culturomica sp.]
MENPFETNQLKRPTFLTVLCILTFIGSGWGVLSQLFSLLFTNLVDVSAQTEQLNTMMDNMESGAGTSFLSGILSSSQEVMQATMMHAKSIAVISLVLSLLSLCGAILMFSLRRIGFYIYTVAQLLLLFVVPYFAGFSMIVVMGMLFSALFTVVFIILYALNLKAMR